VPSKLTFSASNRQLDVDAKSSGAERLPNWLEAMAYI